LGKNGNIVERFVENTTDFTPFIGKTMLLTSDKDKTNIIEDEDRFVSNVSSTNLE